MIHQDQRFTKESFDKGDTERKCAGMAGRVWLCPHVVFSHEQVHREQRWPFGSIPRTWGPCDHCGNIVDVRESDSLTIFLILTVSDDADLQKRRAGKFLRGLHAPICPHFRLSSAFVIKAHARYRQFIKGDIDASEYRYDQSPLMNILHVMQASASNSIPCDISEKGSFGSRPGQTSLRPEQPPTPLGLASSDNLWRSGHWSPCGNIHPRSAGLVSLFGTCRLSRGVLRNLSLSGLYTGVK